MKALVEVDGRRRVSLAQHVPAEQAADRYLIDVEPDGTIILTPAVTMSRVEAKVGARRDILDRVDANRAAGYPGQHTGIPPRQ